MTHQPLPRATTVHWSTVVWIVGSIVGLAWIAPAMHYNLDWSRGSLAENLFAAILVLGAAAAFTACHWVKSRWQALLAVLLALSLTFNNSWNALEVIAIKDDGRVDGRRTEIDDASRLKSARSTWSTKVDAARKVVGDTPWSKYNSDAESYRLADAPKWKSSRSCIDVDRSKAYCAEYARLRGLADTAKERDDAAAHVLKIDAKAEGRTEHTHADPMAATVVSMLALFGVPDTPEVRKGIRHWRSFFKTLAIEALAAAMPLLWICLIEGLISAIESMISAGRAAARLAVAAQTRVTRQPAEKHEIAAPASVEREAHKPAAIKTPPEFLRWCSDDLEQGATFTIDVTPAYHLHCDWRLRHGLPHISQKRFGTWMGAEFDRHRNSGYPFYMGVRAKPKGPRLVASNA